MININRNNYEKYFVDFLDGNLSQSEKEEILLFLDQNLDLKEELEFYKDELVLEEEIRYSHKQELKRLPILSGTNATNFDELCIASLEKDLNDTEEKKFSEYLKENEQRQRNYDLFKLTLVEKDEFIVFPEKSRLKKKELSLRRNYYTLSIAASIIILIALYILLPKQPVESTMLENHVAEVSKEKEPAMLEQAEKDSFDEVELNRITPTRNDKEIGNTNLLNSKYKNLKPINDNTFNRGETQIVKLSPLEINYNFEVSAVSANLADVRTEKFMIESITEPSNFLTIRGFLASSFNERVLNKKEKDKIELFDIAQASVKGINKITGSNMSLERIYDENGVPDKTEFTSNLIAFSTPIKKVK